MSKGWTVGVSTFVWTSPLRDAEATRLLPHIRCLGFDAVEIPLEQPEDLSAEVLRRLLADSGLTPVIGAVFAPGRELCGTDAATVTATQDYLRRCVDYAVEVGSQLIVGPMYTSVGRCQRMSPRTRLSLVAEYQQNLAPIVDLAAGGGRRLGIEPLNRYETSLFNTVDQVMAAVGVFDTRTVGLTFDTYHANIEEKLPWDALRRCGVRLAYVQASGSDRGAAGRDHTDWVKMKTVLAELDYDGHVTVESFTDDNDTIAVAASMWRPVEPSADELASASQAFLTGLRDGILPDVHREGTAKMTPGGADVTPVERT